jgi:hypothetical protein
VREAGVPNAFCGIVVTPEARIVPIHVDENRIIIYANEVVYHGGTGEIETRGDARITVAKAL